MSPGIDPGPLGPVPLEWVFRISVQALTAIRTANGASFRMSLRIGFVLVQSGSRRKIPVPVVIDPDHP